MTYSLQNFTIDISSTVPGNSVHTFYDHLDAIATVSQLSSYRSYRSINANSSLPDSVGRSILFSSTMRRSLDLNAILDLAVAGNSLPVSDIGDKTVGRKRNVSVETARFRGLTTLKFCDPRRGTVERGRRGW